MLGKLAVQWVVLAACLAVLNACGRSDPPTQSAAARPPVAADGFDPEQLDPNRPCTLLREVDAERITGQPFYITMASDRVEDERVRCARAVGVGGLHYVVEATILNPRAHETAELRFAALCRELDLQAPPTEPTAAAKTVDPGPSVPGRACRLSNGGFAILMPDRVLLAIVRGGAGEIDAGGSQRLAALLASRVAVGRRAT